MAACVVLVVLWMTDHTIVHSDRAAGNGRHGGCLVLMAFRTWSNIDAIVWALEWEIDLVETIGGISIMLYEQKYKRTGYPCASPTLAAVSVESLIESLF